MLIVFAIVFAIVQPIVLVALGAWLWHRAQAGRSPVPDLFGALRDVVTAHRRPTDEPPANPDDELLEPPPFKA